MRGDIQLVVNGRAHALAVPRDAPLLNILRNDLGLNGPKYGCGLGECGACAVLVDGNLARACMIPVGGVAGRAITTLEGLAWPGWLGAVRRCTRCSKRSSTAKPRSAATA